jgi:predicted TIM-barrel fold metal-dependent hydrolase
MKIDVFPHILPIKYKEALHKEIGPGHLKELHEIVPTLTDLDYRLRIMDKFEGLMQILNIAAPPVENIGNKQKAIDLAKLANDEMAELIHKYPDKFPAAIACLPMNDMDAAINELDRAIKDLHFRGVQIFTPINDKPLDSPEFFPLYEKMCQYDLPILLHPQREVDYPDYRTEDSSKYGLNTLFGWPYETSAAMVRLVLSGVMERYPVLKIITHHGGGMVPFLEKRITGQYDAGEVVNRKGYKDNLRKPPIDYFRMFYADTAIYGHTGGLMCSYDFFGAQHLLFGTDMPFDSQYGLRYTKETIESIERMDISDAEKKMIFEDNVKKIMRLPI